MVKYYLVALFSFGTLFLFSQEEEKEVDPVCAKPNKKATKYIEQAKKADVPIVCVENFNKAIAADKENATPYYEYGMYAYTQGTEYYQMGRGADGAKSYLTSESYLKKALDICPEFHAGIFYYLGIIKYAQKDQESAKSYFEQFAAYKDPDYDRYPNNYPKMLKDVKELLKKWREEEEFQLEEVPYEPFLVPVVNSGNDEYFPMISPDNELMFFTRKLDRKNLGDGIISNIVEEFTISQRSDVGSPWDKGIPFSKPFNDGTFQSYGAATMSVDNKEMIICACQQTRVSGQDYLNCDLYETHYTRSGKGGNDFSWTPLKSLGPYINTPDGWEGQPSLSADGNTLYFTAMRRTTRDNDIFISKRQPDGSWGIAVPFNEVNTAGKDKSPFIHQDNETFYFVSSSSDERRGAGGLDIFYIRKQDDGSWTKPKNIGVPINSPDDELGLFVSAEGSIAYFSSRYQGDWGIYGFDLYLEARPESVVVVKGKLVDDEGEPIKDAAVEVAYEDGETQTFKVNGDDGRYAAVVKTGKDSDVALTVKKENTAYTSTYIPKEKIAEVTQKKTVKITTKDLVTKPLKLGEEYEIADITYRTNSAELSAKSKLILSQFASYLKSNPTLAVEIGGHTDDVGDDAENLKLSEERAQGVKDFLVTCGVDKKRLSAKGYGETQPKMENNSEENRAQNRRTVFRINKL